MQNTPVFFDHVHLISRDPQAAADWYVGMLGGREVASTEVGGAPQILVGFEGANIIIRGQRTGEQAVDRLDLQWGMDHFGFSVRGDFDAFCADLKSKGVAFTVEPVDFTPKLRLAFIKAPDDVIIELLQRKP